MEAGELPGEPEKTLDAGSQRDVGEEDGEADVGEMDVDMDADADTEVPAPMSAVDALKKMKTKTKKTKSARASANEETAKPPTLTSDAFFDEDD
jgi:hypothetical protein